jgi:steroid 5-alpha reductase family enzyme
MRFICSVLAMVDLGATLAITAATVLTLLLATYAASRPLNDVSIVDIAWGLAFVDVAWVAGAVAGGDATRTALAVVLATVWGLRLAGYIALRKARHPGEDPRYARIRNQFVTVFLLQAALAWIISLPLQAAAAATDPDLGALALAGAALWALGFAFEAVGDHQLVRFRASGRGGVMDQGLWRYTRHPNYFGDCCVWWGLFLIAADGGAWWTAVSPLIMTVLLTRVSGKDLLEKSLSKRAGYAEYVERTSGFIPLPPRGARGAAGTTSR